MKKTLLDMVQSIMSSMDSDEVNSISDTAESLQVAGFLRDSYYEIISGLNLPNTYTLLQLEASLDPTKPTLMHMPSNIQSITWLKYNKQMLEDLAAVQAEPPGFFTAANGNASYNYQPQVTESDDSLGPPNFAEVHFLPLEHFLQRMYQVGNNESSDTLNDVGSFNLTTASGGNFVIYYRNDRAPLHWTTFDDNTVLFDSYDASVDTTLQSSKTVGWGELSQEWQMVDSFIPNLNDKQFTLLENEAKQQAFVEAKQSSNPIAAQRAHKGWVRARRNKHRTPYEENSRIHTTTSHFGRRSYPRANAGTYRDHEPN